MPSLYPINDISLDPGLFKKRCYLESVLMLPDINDKLALVLRFWNSLGGLQGNDNSITAIHLPEPGLSRRDKNTTRSSDRMDIDDIHSDPHAHPSTGFQCYKGDCPLENFNANGKRKTSGRVITWPSAHETKRRCRRSSDMDLDTENADLDEPPELYVDEDSECEGGEMLRVPKVRYYLPDAAQLDADRRKFGGEWLGEELEADEGATAVDDGLWTHNFSQLGLL